MWWPFSRKYPERSPEDVDCREYDYVVVGGGTAGCVVASRLSEDPNISVLVIERGPANDLWFSRIPIVSSNILRSDGGATSWNCEPMAHCGGRKTLFFRAEVLGGGSRINSMVYTRGSPADYDSFVHAAVALGFPIISDANAPDAPLDGVCQLDSTVNASNQRVSTMDAFLSREIALKRKNNLDVCTNAILSKIVFSDPKESGQPRANKVSFKYTDSKKEDLFIAKVRREVIVCSGAIWSPQPLMLSGIGPKAHLEQLSIPVVKDLPGVGSELVYKSLATLSLSSASKVTLTYSLDRSFGRTSRLGGTHQRILDRIASSPVTKGAIEFFKYLLFRTGLLSMPVQALTLFLRSSSLNKEGNRLESRVSKDSTKLPPQALVPDLEIMPLATSACDDLEEHYRVFDKIRVFSSLATLLQPKSRGTVRLASSKPHDRPKIDFGILSNP
ncbi:hypothetical protein BJ875DRAFT_485473 [Amylocarpus encephaloides]|uniref:Glucose-methanol-choline oxidoreductase N-terminal domain-containing protein n=1 Tax=Amylocarpus encephaloides TaxID=45428 RepID=A0A9P7YH66_9HELO|nr:hypothetical protein BJ875DRAFT_485473 [Amylocarpus encephaloides]